MIDNINKHLNNVSVLDIENGFFQDGNSHAYICLFCDTRFEDGVVYPFDNVLLLPERAVQRHVADTHGDVFNVLLDLGKTHTGLSEIQQALMRHIYNGFTDRQIAGKLGGKSPSTVRNHRFQMRKRKKEAQVFLAIMNLLERKDARQFVDFHGNLPVQDDRVIVTSEEAQKIMEKYFKQEKALSLKAFPRKQKTKLVILNRISELFKRGQRYTEKEVNRILTPVYADYVTIRRYLIDYGFLDRKPDGSEYWLR